MEEDISINKLKKKVFFDLLELAGRVFISLRYSDNIKIGDRGFIGNEREMGLTLIFNSKMRFIWDGDIIEALLSFNGRIQKCIIPVDNVMAVYSPELKTQFITSYAHEEVPDTDDAEIEDKSGENVIKVDFTRKKKGQP